MQYVFTVTGLDGQMCAMTLEKKIKADIEAVEYVKVSHRQRLIELELITPMVTDELLKLIEACAKVCDGHVVITVAK